MRRKLALLVSTECHRLVQTLWYIHCYTLRITFLPHNNETYVTGLLVSLMLAEGSAFNRNSDAPLATAPLRPIRPNERVLGATPQCSASDLRGFGVDSTPKSSHKNGRSSTEHISVAVPQQLSKAMVSLLASLSARDLSTGISSRRAGLPLLSSMLASYFFPSSDRSASTIVHAACHQSDSLSTDMPISPSSGMLPSMDLLARSVMQMRPIEMR